MKRPRGIFLAAAAAALLAFAANASYEVPVLMYHRIDSPVDGSTVVTPENFERQMEFLRVHRYNVMPLAELADRLREGRPIPPKTVVLTFDDGTIDNFTNAFPVLKKLGFPATVFMITENIDREGWLAAEDLRILDQSGVTIGSHTATHAFLPKTDPARIETELDESRRKIEKILGHSVELFSYPAGGVTRTARSMVQRSGFDAAVTTNYGRVRHDPLALHRIKISDARGDLFSFWAKTSGFYHVGKKRAPIAEGS